MWMAKKGQKVWQQIQAFGPGLNFEQNSPHGIEGFNFFVLLKKIVFFCCPNFVLSLSSNLPTPPAYQSFSLQFVLYFTLHLLDFFSIKQVLWTTLAGCKYFYNFVHNFDTFASNCYLFLESPFMPTAFLKNLELILVKLC